MNIGSIEIATYKYGESGKTGIGFFYPGKGVVHEIPLNDWYREAWIYFKFWLLSLLWKEVLTISDVLRKIPQPPNPTSPIGLN